MIKFIVPKVETRSMSGTSKTSGKPYNLEFQTVYAALLGRDGKPGLYPEKTEIILDRDKDGTPIVYPPGEYTLHPASLYLDRRGSLAVAPRLQPVPKTV